MITTDRGDRFTASYIGVGTGPLHVPKLPGIPGIDSFEGHSFHTSRWDYDYTGGDAAGAPMTGLADKRVAIIGTGATSVQAVPHLARSAGKDFTSSSARHPRSTCAPTRRSIPDWFAGIATPGWQQPLAGEFYRQPEPAACVDGGSGPGRLDRSVAADPRQVQASAPRGADAGRRCSRAFEDSDFEKMEEIRARVDAIVADRETAQRAEGVVPPIVQAAVLPRCLSAGLQQPGTT